MLNKNYLNKVSLFLIVICGLFLFIPNTVIAAVNPTQWVQNNVKVDANKVWKIKFNQAINADKLAANIRVYNPIGLSVQIKTSYANNTITVQPVSAYIPGQTYSLQICEAVTGLYSNPLKAPVTMSFTIAVPDNGKLTNTINKSYAYKQYNMTLDQMVAIQSKSSPVNVVNNYYLAPSNVDIYQYLNPENFEYHDYAVYQFLTLNYIEGITAEELNTALLGKGILEGQGKTFLDACLKYNINPAYIIAHTLLETGNGSSVLANGVLVSEVSGQVLEESKITYNMFGIGAYDVNALKLGAEKAYKEGWFTPEAAIEGGIKWISDNYVNSTIFKQDTLYKMRWNPAVPANGIRHQYATDISWAYKQSYRIKQILDKCTNANLIFEIPQYK